MRISTAWNRPPQGLKPHLRSALEPTSPAAPVKPEPDPRLEAARAERRLHAEAAFYTAQSYGGAAAFEAVVCATGATHYACLADEDFITVGQAFVKDGRAWIVFHGTNEKNDWARNVQCLPAWHPGFRISFKSIEAVMQAWVDSLAGLDVIFCVTGHSLGGAVATLVADRLARDGRPVALLCTFGGPRVFAFWQAWGFDGRSAKLPERRTGLVDVTIRYIHPLELVCHVPPFLLGFRHIGRKQLCTPIESPARRAFVSTPARFGVGLSEGGMLADAWEAACRAYQAVPIAAVLASVAVGFAVLLAATFAGLLLALWLAPQLPFLIRKRLKSGFNAHAMNLYARHLDAEGDFTAPLDALLRRRLEGDWPNEATRLLLATKITLAAVLILAIPLSVFLVAFIVGLIGLLLAGGAALIYGAYYGARYMIANVDWQTNAGILALFLATFLGDFLPKQAKRAEDRKIKRSVLAPPQWIRPLSPEISEELRRRLEDKH